VRHGRIPQVATARVWNDTACMGEPGAMQMATPPTIASASPLPRTRVAPTIHCPLTHGGVEVLASAQPAIVYGVVVCTTGCPDTSTRGYGAVDTALPPCMHMTEEPKWRMGPGIVFVS